MEHIDPNTLNEWQQRDDIVVIDIRTEEEYAQGHIADSINAPLDTITTFDFAESEQKTAVFNCQRGRRTTIAAPILQSLPFKTHYCLDGGLNAWQEAGFKIKK